MDIEVRDLYKKYQDQSVFDGFTCTFYGGRVNFLMGVSGCGKTSLIKIIMGLEDYQSGMVTYLANSRVSYVGQSDSLLENMSIYKNISLVNDSISESDLAREMARLGLDMSIRKRVRELSGGQKRRLAILKATLYESSVFIMDEPFKGLDEDNKKIVMDYTIEKITGSGKNPSSDMTRCLGQISNIDKNESPDKITTTIIVSHDEDEFKYFRERLGDNVFLKYID